MPGEDLSGVALVQRHGSAPIGWAGGLAHRSTAQACTRDTRFQACSVSKQFTAAAVLLLADCGRVALEDPVSRWFSDCPPEWRGISVHHLLTHTSGLGHWPDCPGLDLERPVPREQQMELFQQMPLLSRPGSRWQYSSPGYVLLGWVVQDAGDQPYAAFLADHIFAPLGLRLTSAGNPVGDPGMARGYRAGQPVRSFDLGTTGLGAGDVWSTADDLIRWDGAVAAGELITAGRRQDMLAVHASLGPGQARDRAWIADGYGYAWFAGTVAGRRAYFHPGDNPGYLAFNAWLPDDDIRLAVLANEETTDLDRVVGELLHVAISG